MQNNINQQPAKKRGRPKGWRKVKTDNQVFLEKKVVKTPDSSPSSSSSSLMPIKRRGRPKGWRRNKATTATSCSSPNITTDAIAKQSNNDSVIIDLVRGYMRALKARESINNFIKDTLASIEEKLNNNGEINNVEEEVEGVEGEEKDKNNDEEDDGCCSINNNSITTAISSINCSDVIKVNKDVVKTTAKLISLSDSDDDENKDDETAARYEIALIDNELSSKLFDHSDKNSLFANDNIVFCDLSEFLMFDDFSKFYYSLKEKQDQYYDEPQNDPNTGARRYWAVYNKSDFNGPKKYPLFIVSSTLDLFANKDQKYSFSVYGEENDKRRQKTKGVTEANNDSVLNKKIYRVPGGIFALIPESVFNAYLNRVDDDCKCTFKGDERIVSLAKITEENGSNYCPGFILKSGKVAFLNDRFLLDQKSTQA